MVTDGEPTAHLEGEEVFFSWPPVPETIQKTLQEAMRLARAGVGRSTLFRSRTTRNGWARSNSAAPG